MSETGRKMDVEDVLSSIRRLVSEEAREDQGALEANDASVEKVEQLIDNEPEKLVLTPSLRVPEDEKPVPPTSEIERRIEEMLRRSGERRRRGPDEDEGREGEDGERPRDR